MCTFFIKYINGNSCLFLFSVCYIKILFTSDLRDAYSIFANVTRSQSFQIYIYIFLIFSHCFFDSIYQSFNLSSLMPYKLQLNHNISDTIQLFYNIPASYRNAIRRTQKKVKLRITENQDINYVIIQDYLKISLTCLSRS